VNTFPVLGFTILASAKCRSVSFMPFPISIGHEGLFHFIVTDRHAGDIFIISNLGQMESLQYRVCAF
jgi:hypothetical protein